MPAAARKAVIEMKIPPVYAGGRTFAGAMLLACAASLALFTPLANAAEEMPVVKISARDGKFEPPSVEVPAGKRFRIEISNDGKSPMEFESKDLKQEKVIAAGAKSSIAINALKPGTYTFFDEHHMDAPKGRIVAK
jgi:plastocyanin